MVGSFFEIKGIYMNLLSISIYIYISISIYIYRSILMSGLWQCAGWHHVQPGMVDIVVHLVGTRRVKLESFREAVAQASDNGGLMVV